ncbi:SurA N-terminal domain-containing protein [soil metagenome]
MQWVRDNRRWAQIILIALIIPFACTGVASLRDMQGNADTAAKVGAVTISRGELDRAVSEQLGRLRQMVGSNFDPRIFNTPEARKGVLDDLINQRSMEQESGRLRIVVGDAQLKQLIGREQMFQLNNGFYKQYYDDFAASRGQTAKQLDEALRNDYSVSQFAQMPSQTTVMSNATLTSIAALYGQERMVAKATFDASAYASQVKPTDADITAYYEANKSKFERPQQLDVQFVVLSSGSLGETSKISDADLEQYYQQNQQRFVTPEQRRASHILIEVDSSASAAKRAEAKAKAEKILAEVKANPKDFAKLAAKYSDDAGSKDKGGDLEFTPRGGWVKPFEDAAFAMNKGEISPLVQSDFGYHIIELTDIRPGVVKTLAEVRPQLESEVRAQLGSRALAEQAEAFTNMVYEQPDSLQPAVDRFALKLETAKGVTRNGAPANPAIASPKVVEALFTDDVLRNHRNTPAIETSPGTLVSARVEQVHPAETRPLEEVRADIVRAVTLQQATKLAVQKGEAALAELRAGKSPEGVTFSAPVRVTLQSSSGIAPQLVRDVYRTTAKQTLPAYVGGDIGDQGYQIARVDSVNDPAVATSAPAVQAAGEQVKRAMASAETNAFVAAVRARTKVVVNEAGTPE